MLAIEEAGHPQMAKPAQFSVGLGRQDGRAKRHPFPAGWQDEDMKAGTCLDLAFDPADKRIPLRVSGEVGEHLPDSLGGSVDLDLGVDLFHAGPHPSTPTVIAFAKR